MVHFYNEIVYSHLKEMIQSVESWKNAQDRFLSKKNKTKTHQVAEQ